MYRRNVVKPRKKWKNDKMKKCVDEKRKPIDYFFSINKKKIANVKKMHMLFPIFISNKR